MKHMNALFEFVVKKDLNEYQIRKIGLPLQVTIPGFSLLKGFTRSRLPSVPSSRPLFLALSPSLLFPPSLVWGWVKCTQSASCTRCHRTYLNVTHLRRHERRCHNDETLKCDIYRKYEIRRSDNLRRHRLACLTMAVINSEDEPISNFSPVSADSSVFLLYTYFTFSFLILHTSWT